jgi:hypothetical protein
MQRRSGHSRGVYVSYATFRAMRLMIFLFALVFLVIVDQAWFGGHYTSMVARMLRQWI